MAKNGKRKGKGGKGAPPSALNGANGAASAHADESDEPVASGKSAADPAVPSVPPLAADASVDPEPPEPLPAEAAKVHEEEEPKALAAFDPIYRFDQAWTKFESRLILFVLFAELASLCAWVLLNDMTEVSQKAGAHGTTGGSDGTIFRGILGAVAIGCAGWFATKKQALGVRRGAAIGGAILGAALAPAWAGVGAAYLDNLKVWLQEGSTLTLMGGLRGVATRLTLWLALLGGSLATGAGRHIHIDLVYRLLPKRLRLPASLVSMGAAAIVCFAGVWGFLDHIAINSFGSKADDSAGAKIAQISHSVGDDLWLTYKQVGLDVRSLPHVIAGGRYDQWMTGKAWNEWVDGAGFQSRYTAEQIQSLRVPDDTPTHTPVVLSPDGTTTRGLLVNVLGLVFPFGLFAIGLRFILRMTLTFSGHYSTDPDRAHKEELAELAANAAHAAAERTV